MKWFWISLILAIALVGTSQLFSLVSTPPSCETARGGGSCPLSFTLPQDRASSLYTFSISTQEIEGVFIDAQTVLTPVDSISLTDEDDRDEISCNYDDKLNEIYMYKIPANWGEVYSMNLNVLADATASTKNTGSSIYIYPLIYSHPFVKTDTKIDICKESSTHDCENGNYAQFKYYFSDRYREYKLRFANIDKVDGESDIVLFVEDAQTLVGQIQSITNLPYETFKDKTNDEVVFFVDIVTDVENICKTSATTQEPVVTASYTLKEEPTTITYKINDLEATVNTYTESLDLSNEINEVCNRGENNESCVFTIELITNKGGILTFNEIQNVQSRINKAETVEFWSSKNIIILSAIVAILLWGVYWRVKK